MRVGLLGGSFDPVHNGHLKLALAALRQCKLDRVYLVLTPRSPFKMTQPLSPLTTRLAMLRLAINKIDGLKIGAWEFRRRGPVYTVTTLSNYRKRHPKDEIFFILGSDTWKGFFRWKNPQEILRLAHIVVGRRPGVKKVTHKSQAIILKGLFPDISSTHIRAQSKMNKSLKQWIPTSVEKYVVKKGLYQ
jgi:nicotinate-nucleotide adenylyltransferase